MAQTLVHRGPDDEGVFFQAPSVWASDACRSSISRAAINPCRIKKKRSGWSSTVRFTTSQICALEGLGHNFRTQCDTDHPRIQPVGRGTSKPCWTCSGDFSSAPARSAKPRNRSPHGSHRCTNPSAKRFAKRRWPMPMKPHTSRARSANGCGHSAREWIRLPIASPTESVLSLLAK